MKNKSWIVFGILVILILFTINSIILASAQDPLTDAINKAAAAVNRLEQKTMGGEPATPQPVARQL